MSIRPGIIVASPMSILLASAGICGRAPLPVTSDWIRPLSPITITGLSTTTPFAGSSICAAVTTVTALALVVAANAASAARVHFIGVPLSG
jgi:hypothetical protein